MSVTRAAMPEGKGATLKMGLTESIKRQREDKNVRMCNADPGSLWLCSSLCKMVLCHSGSVAPCVKLF